MEAYGVDGLFVHAGYFFGTLASHRIASSHDPLYTTYKHQHDLPSSSHQEKKSKLSFCI